MNSLPAGSPYRTPIAPRPSGEDRPLWSVMIPTYNCADTLRETLKSVLAQDPGPDSMQIEVVDDCSTRDDPAAVVAELGGGRVAFYRQPQNVGHSLNFNTCLQRARGHIVHVLHGDDCVREGFYAKMQRALADNPAAGAAFCRYISVDEHGNWVRIAPLEQTEDGILPGWLEKIGTGQRLQTPCMVVRREVYEKLDGFDRRLIYFEDWEMWVRIAFQYAVAYVVEPLALYRLSAASSLALGPQLDRYGRDFLQALAIIQPSLPDGRERAILRQARRDFALACIRRGHRTFGAGTSSAVPAQILAALRTDFSFGVVARVVYLGLRWFWLAPREAVPRENGSREA